MLDMTESVAPKSDQINAEDLLTGPRTFTISEVAAGSAEQPINVHLVEFPGRPYRPSKSMRRVMVAAWGKDASQYAGKRLTLFRDPDVKFGGEAVGGIKISHMSDLAKPLKIALTVTRGKRAPYIVTPLPAATPAPTPDELAAQVASALTDATTADEVREWGNRAHGRNLLDLVVDGVTVRDRVATRLAEVTPAEQTAGEESVRGVEGS